ncbi:TetR family transcriptional regulator [Nocardia seriolae]|nr:TetR family transcriptional regulator [Nocardia seriolae]MTJ76148.1 TetR family transcriptional regulator [Nocardia seriolae]MTJ84826.1 TetR family transcriptional regulator [Nocardia seriolae]MTK28813.1 TetR family transcriptional regulator [Nocardia seriolae]MTK38265.1 TetR family transcriptional regulator [Nocardia seriolae]
MSDPNSARSAVSMEATRRRLTEKQAETVDRLTRAAMDVLSREGFAGLTVRMVAAQAGVGTATAYTYFSSKEHLVAEMFWRRLAATEAPAEDETDSTKRVLAVLRQIALLLADEPTLAGAVTAALLGTDPDVAHLRLRIGSEIRRRLIDALGMDADLELVETLEMIYAGALVRAGMGYASYAEIAERMEKSTLRVLKP